MTPDEFKEWFDKLSINDKIKVYEITNNWQMSRPFYDVDEYYQE